MGGWRYKRNNSSDFILTNRDKGQKVAIKYEWCSLKKNLTCSRLGAGCFQGEKTGLGFKVGLFVKAFRLFGPWDDLLGLGSLSYNMRELPM
jgi:hypothetical protein